MKLLPDRTAREPAAEVPVRGATAESDERTRDRVGEELLAHGPLTAAQVAAALGLGAAGVRRHLDAMVDQGLVTVWTDPPVRGRGRGRPARRFVVTSAGHQLMPAAYDDLATAALGFVQRTGGPDAVGAFARERVAGAELRYAPALAAAGSDPRRRAEVLADLLTADGYAATSRPVAAGPAAAGTQLCQGHCPVQQVATQFPQLCEAETEAFSRLLGVHVQRLSTLAAGGHVCTTYVPDVPVRTIDRQHPRTDQHTDQHTGQHQERTSR